MSYMFRRPVDGLTKALLVLAATLAGAWGVAHLGNALGVWVSM